MFTQEATELKLSSVALLLPALNLLISEMRVVQAVREMAQWLRVLPTLPKLLSSIPNNHMVAHNHLK